MRAAMKQRAVEVLFKHKLLILLPALIIVPLSIALALRPRPAEWQAFSTVWVDQYKPLYQDERLGWTPANNQAQLLNNFIHTRTFAVQVLSNTSLAPMLEDPATEADAVHLFWRSASAWPTSNSFVTILVAMHDPDLAYETLQSLVDVYQRTLQERTTTQSQVAVTFQAEGVKQAEAALAKSRAELSAYLAAHPELASRRPDSGLLLTYQDPALARLSSQVDYDEDTYRTERRRYDQLQSLAGAGVEGQHLAFSVVDEPQRPLAPLRPSRLSLLKLPVVGLVLGTMLSSAVALALVLTNRAVQGPFDIQRQLGVPVIGEIPELRRRRWPWQRVPRHAVRMRLAAPAYLPESPTR
jgi:capsular polysaccharide biosynthesis protein